MKISLFQGILLGVFCFAAIVGIFVFASFQGGGSSTEEIGTVVIWGALPKAPFDRALTTARQSNTELKSVSYVHKDVEALQSELVSAIAEGIAPDLVLISHEDLFALGRVIQPISPSLLAERTFKDAFAAGSEIYLISGGSGAYGVPLLIDPLVLFTNRAILASSGIAAAPPSWEAITGLVSRVTSKNPAGNIDRALIALGTYANVSNARGILSALFLQAGVPLSTISSVGARRADLGTSRAAGTPPRAAVVRFYSQFADPSKVSYTLNASLPLSQRYFASGDLALYIGYASEATYFRVANPNLDFDVAPLPQLATGRSKSTYGLMYALVIPRGAANPTGAFKAAAALTDPTLNRAAAAATSLAPAVRSALATPPSEAAAATAYASALYARGWLSPTPTDTDTIFSAMITNVISGRLTIDAALAAAESTLSALLQQ